MSASVKFKPKVTGWSGPGDFFRFPVESAVDPLAVQRVLRGEQLGVLFRCEETASFLQDTSLRFWRSERKFERSSEAPSYYLGAYHYRKAPEEYVREASALSEHVDSVIGPLEHPWRRFLDTLDRSLKAAGAEVRLARYRGMDSAAAALRAWTDQGAYALPVHEDLAQCMDPLQQDFEISNVVNYQLCAINHCIENEGGGELDIWNIRPDDASRRLFGTERIGGPYPMSALASVEHITIEVRPGDIYVFNAAHLHAVRASAGRRMTIYSLMGFGNEHTVLRWT